MNEAPDPIDEPPVGAVNQLSVFPTAVVALNITVPDPQTEPSVVVNTVGLFTLKVYADEVKQLLPLPSLTITL